MRSSKWGNSSYTTVFVGITLLSFLISYVVLCRIFNMFTHFQAPEILLIVFSISLGGLVRLFELIIIAVLSTLSSFALLQFLMFLFFGNLDTFNVLLSAVAKSSALVGLMSMLIVIGVGTISNLLFFKKNGEVSNF